MIFVDGENLVFRYQSMVAAGWKPRTDDVCHISDSVIWHSSFSQGIRLDQVLRATYYTYAVGDDVRVDEIETRIKGLQFTPHRNSTLPSYLTPCVFKKQKQSAKAKGVDIALTVDVLGHVHHDNVDTVILLSGDGDYLPLIKEVQRSGKQCFVSAFSDGLNPSLRKTADSFFLLDEAMFPAGAP